MRARWIACSGAPGDGDSNGADGVRRSWAQQVAATVDEYEQKLKINPRARDSGARVLRDHRPAPTALTLQEWQAGGGGRFSSILLRRRFASEDAKGKYRVAMAEALHVPRWHMKFLAAGAPGFVLCMT